MNRKKHTLLPALLLAFLATVGATTVFAAEKTISSVTLRLDVDIDPGETLPEIDIVNDSDSGESFNGGVCISNSSDRYAIVEAKWITSTSKEMTVGYQPEMRVRLEPRSTGNDDYWFKGTYRSSNVHVKYGTFISSSKNNGDLIVKLKLQPIKGNFEAPTNVYWKDNAKGIARWEAPESGGTGRYQVELRRGSNRIHSVETGSTTYNFYPYMTQAGTYTFRVRTIAKTEREEDYGKKSEWIDSDEIYLAKEEVSDGSGKNNQPISGGPGNTGNPAGNTVVGWQKINGYWYYYYPDGSFRRNGWEKVSEKWYLFNEDGQMLTEWQTVNNRTYYLNSSGEMVLGWVPWEQCWYYLNPTNDENLGSMVFSHWLNLDGKTYYMTESGAMAEGWMQIDGKYYYFYPEAGNMAVNTHIDTFFVDENGVWIK